MPAPKALVKRHPLPAFFFLAFAGFWGLMPLAGIAAPLPLFIGAFVPALAAILVTAVTDGTTGVRALLRRLFIWRAGLPSYLAALGLPAVTSAAAMGVALMLGSTFSGRAGSVVILMPLLTAFAAGEELGWRGFALPRLLAGRSALAASLILGALWAIWHWPVLLPGQMLAGSSVLVHSPTLIVSSVLYTWIYLHSRGSLVPVVLFHAGQNAYGSLFLGRVDPALGAWLSLGWLVLAALVVVLATGWDLKSRPTATATGVSPEQPLIEKELSA
jgi:membrane protease YdiL (CAAX protease family)